MSDTKPTTEPLDVVKHEPSQLVIGERGAEIRNSKDLWSLARLMAYGSGRIKVGATDQERDLVIYNTALVIEAGKNLGFTPVMAMRTLFVVNGRVSHMLEGAVALLRKHNVIPADDADAWIKDYVNLPPDGTPLQKWPDNAACVVRLRRTGWKSHKQESFSVGDAKMAGLWGKGGPWSTYPKRQLYARAGGFMLRDYCSDVTMGVLVVEEARDTPAPADYVREVNPPAEPQRIAPQADPLLKQLGLAQPETVVDAVPTTPEPEPEIIVEPDPPSCECPESGWKTVGDNIVCTACGSVIGPAH